LMKCQGEASSRSRARWFPLPTVPGGSQG
jgi:hypothetical protein